MRVLILRLSSMGDMVHTLPAITDASLAYPGVQLDWAVDQAFSEIPGWHHSVRQVIASPRRSLSNLPSIEFRGFLKTLRSVEYDLVVDLQGHWKSAIVGRFASGIHCGYEKKSVNEWGAHLFYDKKIFVSRKQHSIRRMRELLSRAMGYKFEDQNVDYGIDRSRLPQLHLELRHPYIVFIHSTSWESKCWREDYWQNLARKAMDSGMQVVLPWGNESERFRAERIAAKERNVFVLPDLNISQKASVIAGASATVGLDTGLSHIAAALDVPSITIYGATDPFLIGATGKNQTHILSDFECVKCHQSSCNYSPRSGSSPACLDEITPEIVWNSLIANCKLQIAK